MKALMRKSEKPAKRCYMHSDPIFARACMDVHV